MLIQARVKLDDQSALISINAEDHDAVLPTKRIGSSFGSLRRGEMPAEGHTLD
jgi:hypothetical protein